MDLAQKKCVPCERGTLPMQKEAAARLMKQVSGWQLLQISGVDAIEKKYKFRDFAEAMMFVNKVAALAEEEGHHPDIKISWNKVTLTLWTHAIKGLSENDFIMAAKIDAL
ncbi:4a-hydroxytetrahydrobiopterin dehydratase [Candidatus Woesearchaeota archaeon]|nr:4a-hydroxytetrahydrobiopterin dehydratase [Candidatus Woesearchaeota archaeon]